MEQLDNIVAPGTVIDSKYEIGGVIGSGGMGTVYEAIQVGLNRKVAIKLLHPRYARSPKIIHRFHQEAKLAGSIEHDNICRVTDHGTDENGAPYLVMPMLSGKSLRAMLDEKAPLSTLRIIDIVCQTLSALGAAHREKIVHRDLKPDNIFVTQMGDREDFVKLLDFGISKVMEKQSTSELTSTGMVLGTAFYLAPEQARGSKHIDQRVDIYAMGVILYEALTGKRPFEGETYNEVVFKIAGEPVKLPSLLNPAISRSVEQVILKAMSIDPSERYESAVEMCAALENAVVNGGSGRTDVTTDTLGDTLPDDEARPTRTAALSPPAAGGSGRPVMVAVALLIVAVAGVAIWKLGSGEEAGDAAGAGTTRAWDTDSAQGGLVSPDPGVVEPPSAVDSAMGSAVETETEPENRSGELASDTGERDTAAQDTHGRRDREGEEKREVRPSTKEAPSVHPKGSEAGKPASRGGGRKGSKGRGGQKGKGDVIKGKFNTTFVFEEE